MTIAARASGLQVDSRVVPDFTLEFGGVLIACFPQTTTPKNISEQFASFLCGNVFSPAIAIIAPFVRITVAELPAGDSLERALCHRELSRDQVAAVCRHLRISPNTVISNIHGATARTVILCLAAICHGHRSLVVDSAGLDPTGIRTVVRDVRSFAPSPVALVLLSHHQLSHEDVSFYECDHVITVA